MEREQIAGPAGTLELVLDEPAGEPRALAVICHPHPQYGGTLNNKVVHQLARTFRELGAVSVRFNFRGVGRSEGEYDEGRGEGRDLFAVVAWARERWPGLPLWLGGFSFGGFVAIQAAGSLRPARLVTVAPAVNYVPEQSFDLSSIDWFIIHGDADDVVPLADVRRLRDEQSHPPPLLVLNGAGHFFHGRLNDLKQAMLDYLSTD